MLVVLAGCASTAEPVTEAADAAAESAAVATDPIAAFALQAASGERGTVRLDGGQQVHVVVGPQYVSAAHNACRRLFLRTDGGGSIVSAACRTDEGWRTILMP